MSYLPYLSLSSSSLKWGILVNVLPRYKSNRYFYFYYDIYYISVSLFKIDRGLYLYLDIMKFIMRNWLTWICRLISPMVCHLQAGVPGIRWCSLKAWEPANDVDSSLSLKAWDRSAKGRYRVNSNFLCLFDLFKPSADLVVPLNTGEHHLLYSV